MDIKQFLAELKQRHVYRTVVLYTVVVFGLWQAADIAIPALSLPERLMTFIVAGALAGFPVVVILSWLYDLRAASPERRFPWHRLFTLQTIGVVVAVAGLIAFSGGLAYRAYSARAEARPAETVLPANFEMGRERFFGGELGEAAQIFAAVGKDASVEIDRRQEAFRYLVRIYCQTGDTAQARDAMRSLLSLEPPLALMMPSVESDTVMKLYYEMRQEKLAHAGVATTPAAIKAVAIFRFVMLGEKPVDLSESAWQELGGSSVLLDQELMQRSPGVKIIDRQQVGFDAYRYLASPEASRLTRPSHYVFGSMAARGNQLLLSAWVFDAQTGARVHSAQVLGQFDNLFDLISRLADQLAAGMGGSGR